MDFLLQKYYQTNFFSFGRQSAQITCNLYRNKSNARCSVQIKKTQRVKVVLTIKSSELDRAKHCQAGTAPAIHLRQSNASPVCSI